MAKEVVKIDRREFTLQSLVAVLAGATITLSGCGSDEPSSPTPAGDETGTISNNHGHAAVITSAQLTAGGALMLSIQGTASHSHTLELTVAEIEQIRNEQRVSKDSSTDASHNHAVTFN